jgi:SpoIIAA-like
MFQLLPETRDNLIAVKMFGVVSAADYEQFMPNIEDLIARAAPALAFVDWEDFDGWAADAEWYSFWYRVTNRRAFERVAIVARETWQDEVAHVARLLDRAEVRRFEPAEHVAAWAWIMGS